MVRWRDAWARYGPVPGATTMAGWALLPLRAFLGFTFTFAGLQKLANPGFFDASNPASIQSQLTAAARRSPIHGLVAHLVHVAVPLGVFIALGEVAIGVATLVGLWTRLAAGAGMLLSFGLFLTISFHASPYYTGSDIVFVFAWTPLLVAGAGGVLSADAVSTDLARRDAGAGPASLVPLPFETVQQICGSYDRGTCKARKRAPCEPMPCPYLARGPHTAPRPDKDAIDRRAFTIRGMVAGAVAVAAVLGAGLAAGLGRLVGGATQRSGAPTLGSSAAASSTTAAPSTSTTAGSPTSSSTPASTTPVKQPSGTRIGAASVVPVGGAASFQDPSSGDPSLVVQPTAGKFIAFDAVCPHAGCIVEYSGSDGKFICPCHGSVFNGRTGNVEQGPAATGLGRITIAKGSDGQLYVS
ncbi:MAG TPA: Rieske 2Fe-2S domain-containing protein [Acidimicrobiales bacterium]|nr:Rieske 2Fe-2S domain-containing protein [Acidimicrobiales bacterium]